MIHQVKGDATSMAHGTASKCAIIPHITNNKGGWGSGFVLAVSAKWKEPEKVYRYTLPILGDVHFVYVEKGTLVANMCAQDGFSTKGNPSCSLTHLKICLQKVLAVAEQYEAEIHMPKFGGGLGGRDFDTEILPLVESVFKDSDLDIFVYTF